MGVQSLYQAGPQIQLELEALPACDGTITLPPTDLRRSTGKTPLAAVRYFRQSKIMGVVFVHPFDLLLFFTAGRIFGP